MYNPGDYYQTIHLTSSECDVAENPQPPKTRKLNARLAQLLHRFNESGPGATHSAERADVSPPSSSQDESSSNSVRALAPSRLPTPTLSISRPVSVLIDQARSSETQAFGNQRTNFYKWLMTTVIVDDLSFREPFINPARDASQLTEEDLLLQGVDLYRNAEQLRPQELVDLPFIPLPMRTGKTMLDIPFLDPLLVVLWDIHIDDLHWMLNVLPWRVVDRPIRTGRSILAWILKIGSIHTFLETTRAPLSVTVKIIRFLDNFFE